MSRRKQDNPMQLKRALTGAAADEEMDPDPLEADEAPQQDLIQCGDCHASFALADIVKFIAHKRTCVPGGHQEQHVVSSEEVQHCGEEGEGMDDEKPTAAEITSINTTNSHDSIVRTEKPKILFRRRSLHDQSCGVYPLAKETQTDLLRDEVPEEPLVCLTCKGSFYSAAELLRHVQEDHGLHIYQDDSRQDYSLGMEEEAENDRPTIVTDIIKEDESKDTTTEKSLSSDSVEASTDQRQDEEQRQREKASTPEPDAAEALVTSSHPQEPTQPPDSRHLPLPSDHSPLPIYIRHPLVGGDRYPFGSGERYFPVPLNPFHMDYMPPNHHPSENVPVMPSPFEGSARIPFSSASSQTSPLDESAAQRLRSMVDMSSPVREQQQMEFSPFPRPGYRPAFPPKLKSCEFCGKLFRFQSNLIVHRRSHTGEKPYKCSLCDHACSQASKLKRHMKTHKNGNAESTSRTPNGDSREDDNDGSSGKNSSNNSTIDEEEEDEMEIEEEEMPPPLLREEPSNDHEPTTSQQKDNNSLLGDVMKNTGLAEIQQYKEAYIQAVAEQHCVVSPSQLYDSSISSLLARKPEINGPLGGPGSSRHTPTSTPSPGRQKTPLPSPIQKSLPLPPSLPSQPFESSPPPLESDRDREQSKRFKLEPTSPPSARTPPRAAPIWTSIHPPNFFTPVLGGFNPHGHPPPVLSSHHHNGSLSIMPGDHHRRFFPGRGSEPQVAPSVLPFHGAPHPRRRNSAGGIGNRRTDECEFCGKVFKNCSNLTVHRRSHTGEKPYKCELCSYACAQSSKLTRHMKTHGKGAKEVFKCEVCGMPFSVYSTLEKHMKKEHWGSIKGPAPRSDNSIGPRVQSYKPLSN